MKTLISIVGTTGIGKTKLAIKLAQYFCTEIISCDSRQFFREMKIGTAAPTTQELAEVPHNFVGHLGVTDYYSIGQFEIEALKKLETIFRTHDVALMVGGSMMYEKAVVSGLNNLPESSDDNQKRLHELWGKQGLEALQKMLRDLDPEYYQIVDRNNPRRLLRALDVIWQTGKTYTQLVAEPSRPRTFQTIRIGIQAPREVIYSRIEKRVDKMMQEGLLEEVRRLQEFQDLIPLQTVGYTELFKYLSGIWDLDFAVSEIKKNSRRFAKRQLTWYRKEHDIHWVNYENAFSESLSLLQDSLNEK